MKPFLLLSSRPEELAARQEAAAISKFGKLPPTQLHQIRLEQAPLADLELADYSGVILGGGPFNTSELSKSELQLRVEGDLRRVLESVISQDLPFLGLCYGVGTVTSFLGGTVDREYGESVGAIDVSLTEAGTNDPLLEGLPHNFRAFVGHKEACSQLPADAVLLARGQRCPIQMFRVGRNCYVTQFHPELDATGLIDRIRIYKHAGYFAPEETQSLIAAAEKAAISPEVHSIISRFVARFKN